MILYALTIFVSAFLLFLLQPIIAKQILPWFGGSAAVWTTCLVFFQCALLAGYAYSDWISRKTTPRTQGWAHAGLLVAAILLLPIIPDAAWKPVGSENPSLHILLLLLATIGLPYFLLSTTSPLIQVWFSRRYPGVNPYRLFALSNLASMLALLGYPFLIEPWFTTRMQSMAWSIGFILFGILAGLSAWLSIPSRQSTFTAATGPADLSESLSDSDTPPTIKDKLIWIALASLSSILLLAISNHLTQNISSIPLLWIVPLALYLLSFILCFDGNGWYRRALFIPLLALLGIAMAWTLADNDLDFMLYWQIGLFSAGLFVACMFCHGELVHLKPAPRFLTTFYLMISIGGALGALLVGIAAPMTLPAYFELAIALILLAAMATYLSWGKRYVSLTYLGITITLFTATATGYTIHEFRENVVVMSRNFYGTLRVKQYGKPDEDTRRRSLVHGAILHGDQFQADAYRYTPTTYYKTTSGIGKTIQLKQKLKPGQPLHIGIIGLGTGTIAAYGKKGDAYRFYEINPQVMDIALREFTYLSDSAASKKIVLGDARLSLEREPKQDFDVLAIDAFSSDSIPTHLITREAVDIFQRHMKPDGVIAYHVSNRFLDLKPVVQMIAENKGLHVAWIHESHTDGATSSDWILLTQDKSLLLKPDLLDATFLIPPQPGWRLWTDDFNNLVQVLK